MANQYVAGAPEGPPGVGLTTLPAAVRAAARACGQQVLRDVSQSKSWANGAHQ